MRKIITNLVVLSVLGSSAFTMESNEDILKKWFVSKVSGGLIKYVDVDNKVAKAAMSWAFNAVTGKDDISVHVKDVETAKIYGSVSGITMQKLRNKCLGNLPDNVICKVQDKWEEIAKSNEPCDFDEYLNTIIKYASAQKMSAKKYLIKLYGTSSQKFWHGIW